MAGNHTYEEQKQLVFKGLMLLAVLTIIEVVFALFARGHIIPSFKYENGTMFHYLYMLVMIGFSIYKAYFIIFNFMHLGSEVRGMAMSIILPVGLLVWAIIAFFDEGEHWHDARKRIQDKNREMTKPAPVPGTHGFYHLSQDAFGNWS
jgi:cytochrome c oxidase subunit IV